MCWLFILTSNLDSHNLTLRVQELDKVGLGDSLDGGSRSSGDVCVQSVLLLDCRSYIDTINWFSIR